MKVFSTMFFTNHYFLESRREIWEYLFANDYEKSSSPVDGAIEHKCMYVRHTVMLSDSAHYLSTTHSNLGAAITIKWR